MDNRTISQRIITAAAGLLLVLSTFAVPAKALTIDESGSLEPRRVVKLYQEVEDTYKAFSCDVAYISEYDVTYKRLYYSNGFTYTGSNPIAYYSGTYKGWNGHITVFKCQYSVW